MLRHPLRPRAGKAQQAPVRGVRDRAPPEWTRRSRYAGQAAADRQALRPGGTTDKRYCDAHEIGRASCRERVWTSEHTAFVEVEDVLFEWAELAPGRRV